MAESKEPIRLRKRTIGGGRQSLYLDIYLDGRRTYEYLKLYLDPEDGKPDTRKRNADTLQLAKAIKAKRVVELQNHRFGFEDDYHTEVRFLDYFYRTCEERKGTPASKGNWGNWYSAYLHLKIYCRRNPDVTFREITPEWVEGFRRYLAKEAICQNRYDKEGNLSAKIPISDSSRQSYWAKLKACLHEAFENHVIPNDPSRGIKGFSVPESERPYLTVDEVRRLAATPCTYPGLRRAFLFSCLTGLRKSDIMLLRWADVREEGGHTRIVFRQKKTKGQEYLDISPAAVPYLGERRGQQDLVFYDFKYSSSSNAELRMWAARAGVLKDFAFHCGRHTFAVMMLDLGADIYTVSKLLGHREIKTTQIYANILDKKKQDAVAMIPGIEL